MRSSSGQASVEYIAALALVVLIFAGAGVAVAAPDLPGTVVHRLRVALCIVGGDVCRTADAAARGLEPCVLDDEEHARETGVEVLFFRSSGGETWSVQRLSDGRIVLSAGYSQGLEGSTGIGAELGPVNAGGSVSGGAGFRSGMAWVLAGEAELRSILARIDGFQLTNPLHTVPARLPRPDETFLEGGGSGSADLAAEAVKGFPGGGGDARAALGRRRRDGATTYYLDLGGDGTGPLAELVPGIDVRGGVTAEYTTTTPPSITLRAAGRRHDDEETETVLHLALRTPEDRAAARRVAFVDLSDPTLAVRDLLARVQARGTVQRFTYRTSTKETSWSYGVELGVKLGADHEVSVTSRELVDARVVNGPLPAVRADCLGLG